MAKVIPVVLAGGVGSRLWPLSREDRPKQFLPLISDKTMLQDTLLRLRDEALFTDPAVVCHERYADVVDAQAAEIGVRLSALILEPSPRNSAPAVAAAAAFANLSDPGATLLISPADHMIADPAEFRAAVAAARPLVDTGRLTTFGVAPDRPETGYGYIKSGQPIPDAPGRAVAAFVEKPDRETAEGYLRSGDYSWNSGMFLFRAKDMLRELRRHEPELLDAVETALDQAERRGSRIVLDPDAFERSPKISIDYAVMEKTHCAAVATVSFGWSDIGAWDALADKMPVDGLGNLEIGAATLIDTRNVYCRSEGPFVAAIGVDDLVIVATHDAVLVCRKNDAQRVKDAFGRHKAASERSD